MTGRTIGQPASPATPPILEVRGLAVSFRTSAGEVQAVHDISFTVAPGETLAIVGESGSGKSVSALAIMGLLSDPPARITEGTIRFRGIDLLTLPEAAMRRVRGNDIAMIFQEPMTSLNPVMTVGRQIAEALRLHRGVDRRTARTETLALLSLVQIPDPAARIDQYPHELSGGMRQRVMIALALSCDPKLLIADEPTTALDVTVQAQVLDLLRNIRARTGMATLLITHDLGVVAETADRVLVAYAGRVVETAPVRTLLRRPRHPYTRGLLACMPRLSREGHAARAERLPEIPGTVPAASAAAVSGCPFAPRCAFAEDRCRREPQVLTPQDSPDHLAACWRAGRLDDVDP